MDYEKYKYVLSSGLIKRLSTEEFNYQLSLNAFNALNNEVQKYLNHGIEAVKINEWIMKILKRASEYLDEKFDCNESKIRMRILRHNDMVIVLQNLKKDENIIITSTDRHDNDNENITDEHSFSVPEDQDITKYKNYSNSIPITQLISAQSSLVIKNCRRRWKD